MAVSFGGFWAHGVTQNSEANMNQCLIGWGTEAEIGALNVATYKGCALYATDTKQEWFSDGSNWLPMALAINKAQTIYGVQTFDSKPVLPATTPTGNEAASAAFVNTKTGAYTELAGGQNHVNANFSTWQDWDLSAVVAAGTKFVEVVIKGVAAGGVSAGVRKNGSALSRLVSPTGTGNTSITMTVAVDASYIIETYNNDIANVHFDVIGYWS